MKKAAELLKTYLDQIGFDGIYKHFSLIIYYYFSPFRINETSEINPGYFDQIMNENRERWDILKCLMFCSEIKYDDLSDEEKAIADELVKVKILKHDGSILYNLGFQLISFYGFYLIIDGKKNFGKFGRPESYIGFDSYFMIYFIEPEKINMDKRCLDICTGTGVAALYLSGFSRSVVGTDINEKALMLSNFNKYLNNREDKLTIRNEDFSRTLDNNEKFDIITCNPPFVAFPPDVEAPIFARGYDKDGLGHLRLLFKKINSILSDNGTGYFIALLSGDEKQPFFINELREFSKTFNLAIDIFINKRTNLDGLLKQQGNIIQQYNENLSREKIDQKVSHLFKKELNAKALYLSNFIVQPNTTNPRVRIFNRYIKRPGESKEHFNFDDFFKSTYLASITEKR